MNDIIEWIGGIVLVGIAILIAALTLGNGAAVSFARGLTEYSGFLSLSFSAVLATLYLMQWKTQKDVQKLTEAQYHPDIKAYLDFDGPMLMNLYIHNIGTAAAHDVHFEWEIGDDETEWAIPVLPEGESHNFPAVEEDGRGIRNFKQLKSHVEEADAQEIHYTIECKDSLGNEHSYSNSIDVLETIRLRTDATEYMGNEDSIQDVVSELESIEQQLDGIKHGVDGDFGSRMVDDLRRNPAAQAPPEEDSDDE